ncbi:hypothetical protein ASE63_07860 [Bosea sp. Root381]|uniref:hypothetical protein n=1 Tax=Bosea sp. Root381 TaxID=1736524 RepID=UPI0006F492A8|nr:hypothetical protein [Bosea sp. Root381]KRE02266.1 hypothetical protein ASE63_07860 [Bosea sp. Root381]
MTRHGNPSRSRTDRPDRPALLRLVVALAVMLVGVLPHATLAASAFHAAAASPAATPPKGAPVDRHAAHRAQAAAPCHDDADASDKAGPSTPSCCVLGCGLLGAGPVSAFAAASPSWRRLVADPALAVAETEPEPAERPPRRAALAG